MKLVRTLILAIAITSSAQLRAKDEVVSIDCTFEAPMGTSLREGEFDRRQVTFQDMTTPWQYRFSLSHVDAGKSTDITIESDRDFATIAGDYSALSVAPDSYIVTAIKVGNCMFSSQLCGAFIQITDIESDKAAAAINPISYFGDQKEVRFFHVDIVGKCAKIEPAEDEN